MDKLFFFKLDYRKTKAAAKVMFDEYNQALINHFDTDPADFRKKFGLRANQTHRAVTLKSSDETTLFAMLEIYHGWLAKNSWIKIEPVAFRLNNPAISTQKNNHMSTRTAIRHVNNLVRAGIIEKTFRGSNASYEVKFNQKLINFLPNSEYNFYLAALYKAALGPVEVLPQAFNAIYSFAGTLTNFALGYTTTSCHHNSTSIILLVHKINMESGIVSANLRLHTGPSEDCTNNALKFEKNLNMEGTQKLCQTLNAPPVAAAPPAAGAAVHNHLIADDLKENKKISKLVETAKNQKEQGKEGVNDHEKLWKEVYSFYCYAVAILWPDRNITEFERNKICHEIYLHYKKIIQDKPVYPSVYSFRGEFMYRILLTRKFLKKNPFWQIESPQSFFDFENQRGFNGTAKWYVNSKKMEEQNKLYLTHYKIFIQCWKDFTKDPGAVSYNLAVQRLGKLKHPDWQDYFNAAVAKLTDVNSVGTQNIYKQSYQANA